MDGNNSQQYWLQTEADQGRTAAECLLHHGLSPDRDVLRKYPAEQARIAWESGIPVVEVDRFFAGFARLRGRLAEIGRMSLRGRPGLVLGLGSPRGVVYLVTWLIVVGLLTARLFGW